MRLLRAASNVLVIAMLAAAGSLLAASCSDYPCDLNDGCSFICEDDDFCDDDRFGEKKHTCLEVYDGSMRRKICSRPCSDSSDCHCMCESSPDSGVCAPGPRKEYEANRPEDLLTCRADAPSIEAMCLKLQSERVASCCTITGSDIEACSEHQQKLPACEKELFEFFLCAYRSENLCVGDGVYAPEECGAQVTALEACAGVTWTVIRPGSC